MVSAAQVSAAQVSTSFNPNQEEEKDDGSA